MTAARGRLKALPAFVVFFALGLFALWLGLSGLATMLQATTALAPIVSFQPRDTIALPPALSLFALAAMTLLPYEPPGPKRTRRRAAGRSGRDWLAILMGVAIVSAALTIVAVPLTNLVVRHILIGRGYMRCPDPQAIAHSPSVRWARMDVVERCFRR